MFRVGEYLLDFGDYMIKHQADAQWVDVVPEEVHLCGVVEDELNELHEARSYSPVHQRQAVRYDSELGLVPSQVFV